MKVNRAVILILFCQDWVTKWAHLTVKKRCTQQLNQNKGEDFYEFYSLRQRHYANLTGYM